MPYLTIAPPIEILLVDDQRAILAGVAALIGSEHPALHVVGCASSGAQALELANSLQPDVIVLDVELGDEDGLDLIPQLRRSCDAAIVVLTAHDHPAVRSRAQQLGAACLVQKSAPGSELLSAIRRSLDCCTKYEAESLV